MWDWFRMIISLIGVIGLILFLFYLLRKVNRHTTASGGSRLRILDRANTGRDSSLLVVSVNGRLMLVGVSTGKIEKLCDLDINEEEYFNTGEEIERPAVSFGSILGNMLGINSKKKEPSEGEGIAVESEHQKSNEGEGF